MIKNVELSKGVDKDIQKAPPQVRKKLALWINTVSNIGLEATRRLPGYHDEQLSGKKKNQRSIRLNLQWRAIYIIKIDGTIEFVEIQEVNSHAYKP